MNDPSTSGSPIPNRAHTSLLKTNLICGCEPIPFGMLLGIVILIAFMFRNPTSITIAAILAVILFPALRALGKHDPQAIGVLLRHIGYQSEYSALPSLLAPRRKPQKWPT